MKNMWGTTSEKLDPLAGTLVCSAPDVSLFDDSPLFSPLATEGSG